MERGKERKHSGKDAVMNNNQSVDCGKWKGKETQWKGCCNEQ